MIYLFIYLFIPIGLSRSSRVPSNVLQVEPSPLHIRHLSSRADDPIIISHPTG